ncbi:hypothetical protein RQP46_000977 [Phenoliferia psychrophenolica]
MSFSFAFDVEDANEDHELAEDVAKLSLATAPAAIADLADDEAASCLPHAQEPLSSLLDTLPPLISYTPVTVALSSPSAASPTTTLLRRDLFDARFQVISQDELEDDSEGEEEQEGQEGGEARQDKGKAREHFVDEESDLVKGVYEGGLKTWECSLDLVDCLYSKHLAGPLGQAGEVDSVRGKSFLEIGCGTALPTCAVFARLIAEVQRAPSSPDGPRPKPTRIHLQDYNTQVLSLITLPNLLLSYAQSFFPAPSDPSSETPAGDIEITPEFLSSFESLLETEAIELEFFSGDWRGFHPAEAYDVVLTSETIYALPSLPPLLDLLQASCRSKGETECLVACKRVYFGVGGGEQEFRRRVEGRGGKVGIVWGEGEGEGRSKGVGRVVMSVEW